MTHSIFSTMLLLALAGYSQEPTDPLAEPRSLLTDGKHAEAESVLHRYLVEHPNSAEAHFLLGYVLFREQKPAESLAEFTAGASMRRPKANELKAVASDYVLLQDYADADKWFTAVTVESPGDADAWYFLGRTKYSENEFGSAISNFERALSLRPKYIEAENNLGLSWKELNDPEKAKAAFEAAIEWQNSVPADPQPFLNLGALLADEGDFGKAVTYLAKAAALSPNNPRIHEELGEVYDSLKNLPQAQLELETAVTLAPDISGLHFKLGQIYRHEGLRDRAQREFELCERLNSSHSSASTPNPPVASRAKPN